MTGSKGVKLVFRKEGDTNTEADMLAFMERLKVPHFGRDFLGYDIVKEGENVVFRYHTCHGIPFSDLELHYHVREIMSDIGYVQVDSGFFGFGPEYDNEKPFEHGNLPPGYWEAVESQWRKAK